ncbi:MAG TPA: PH domain-containing protein [Micromonospora sp.]
MSEAPPPPDPTPPPPPHGAPPPSAAPPAKVDPIPPVGGVPAAEPRRRLHPLTPLLSSAKTGLVAIAALSWQTLSKVGIGGFAVIVTLCLVGALVLGLVSWYTTGYQVVGRELRISEGVLWRRTRAIPLERLQAVEVVRPLLAQLTGLAELRLEVAGSDTEAPLAYLTVDDAHALRERLLTLAGRASASGDGEVEQPGRLLHAVANRDLVISQVLTPQVLLVPLGALGIIAEAFVEGSWGFIAVASTLTAIAGVLLRPVRRILLDWDFRVFLDEAGLRVRRGRLETRSQTVPLDRVQGVIAVWPLLWRPYRWLRLRLEVAGFGGFETDLTVPAEQLLPVGDQHTADRLVAEVFPGVHLAHLSLAAPPRRTRWLHPLTYRRLGVGLTETTVIVRYGRFTPHVVIVPYARIQSVRVVRGPLQRLLGLASVHVDAAAGLTAVARDRDVAEAWQLAAELVRRVHAAQTAR